MSNRVIELGLRVKADGSLAVGVVGQIDQAVVKVVDRIDQVDAALGKINPAPALGAVNQIDQAVVQTVGHVNDIGSALRDVARTPAGNAGARPLVDLSNQATAATNSIKQTRMALRQLPMQMTDVVVGLASGQSPFMVLIQQGGQLKDMFGGIGPAAAAVGGYVRALINPFTVAAAAAAAFGFAVSRYLAAAEKPVLDLKTALSDVDAATSAFGREVHAFSADPLVREFNRADAVTRKNILTLKEYQVELARTAFEDLRKSSLKELAPLGDFTGLFGGAQQEVVEKFFGAFKTNEQRDQWQQLQREIQGGTVDLGRFVQNYGKLFAGGNKEARDFVQKFERVGAEAERLAFAEKKLQQLRNAGGNGKVALDNEHQRTPKVDNGIDDFAREQAKQYAQLYEAGAKYAEGVDLQAAAGRKLTEGERLLATAKAHLTEAQYQEVEAVLAGAIAREREGRAMDDARKRDDARNDALWKGVESYDAEIRKLREHNEEIGLSARALDALRLARMGDAIAAKERELAVAESISADATHIELLRTQVEQMRQLRDMTGSGQALERAHREAVEVWQSVEQAAHSAWSSVGQEGESVFKSLGRTLRSAVLDVLYQMTVKPWIVNIAANVSGQNVASSLGSSLGGGLGGLFDKLFGNVSTAFNYGTNIGSQQTAMLAAQDLAFNAKGGTYASPDLHRYVNSVVDKPTMFAFAKGAGIMGEKPGSPGEAIMPLARLSGGDLGVKVDLGGREAATPVVFQATYAIDARGADVGVEARIRRATAESEARVKEWLLNGLGRGGQLAYATGRRR